MNGTHNKLSLEEIRSRVLAQRGQAMWRSLEELVDQADFREAVAREFPNSIWLGGDERTIDRRAFLQLMGASLVLAGLISIPGCDDKPKNDRIVPYVNPPESLVAGEPKIFATAMPMVGFGKGVLVTSREGRPIKIEGNPDHPASLGGTDSFVQASILSLYDPDRSKVVTFGGEPSTWGAFWEALNSRLRQKKAAGGAGLRILSGPITSPSLGSQRQEFLRQFPQARWHFFSPLSRENTAAGLRAAFGQPLSIQYDLTRAKVVVSLDADFLIDDPGSLRYARQFFDGRRVRRARMEMNRLYVIESTLSITGSMADHRLAVRPSQIGDLTMALASAMNVSGADVPASLDEKSAKWIRALADDLLQHRGECLIVAGESQSPEVQSLAHAMNDVLGNVGQTVKYSDPIEAEPADGENSLASLVAGMHNGRVDTLLIVGENPVYTSPSDLEFSKLLQSLSTQKNSSGEFVNFTAHLGLHEDETSFLCQWHLPEAHYLESWGDVRAFDGTVSLIQPLISPLYQGISFNEFFDKLLIGSARTGYEVVREYWRSRHSGADFETWWRRSLKSGVIEGSALPMRQVSAPKLINVHSTNPKSTSLEIIFRPDYCVLDGSFANNAWLQELPKPFTKLTWGNAALISPKTAEKVGVRDEEVVKLTFNGRSVEAPVLILPGLPEDVVTLHLGYGRTRAGGVGNRSSDGEWDLRGFDAYRLRTSDARWSGQGLQITKTGKKQHLVTTRAHHAMSGTIATEATPVDELELRNRRLVRVGTLDQFKANPNFAKDLGGEREKKPLLSLYPGPEKGGWGYSKGYQWGMSIDMTACMGCNACVIACQAENNIPVVGKREVDRQREMHWIRIDSYFSESLDDPKVYHQPVTCMQCENAPCEYVCPTGATTHSAEGINQMTYNRCVGTRYCSNNCPYKVRRFNFLSYADTETNEPRKLQRNPDVTVRANGVMEKCTYCIQRIQRTRIAAEKMIVDLAEQARATSDEQTRQRLTEESHRREFEILQQLQTACQQACPTRAIEFGSINPVGGNKMHVAELKDEPLDYSLLYELTTKPRTTYLARLRNPNPALNEEVNHPT